MMPQAEWLGWLVAMFIGFLFSACGTLAQSIGGTVQMTEFMADNESGLRDDDGDLSDWIELFNPSAVTVGLGGYQLRAGTTNWTFPPVSLGAGQFLVVFASGKNRTNPLAPLHTNFRLDRTGEYLGLRDNALRVLTEFAPAFPPQQADYSAGPGANGGVVYFREPSPGAKNGDFFSGFLEDFELNVKRGFFTSPVTVVITNIPAGASVYYTVNGSTPTESSSRYTGPLTVSKTTTLRARAIKPGFMSSRVHTGTYLFLSDVLQQTAASAQAYGWPAGTVNGQEFRYGIKANFAALYSPAQITAALQEIPSVSLVTDQRHLTDPATGFYVNPSGTGQDWERPISIELIHPDGSPGFQEDCGIRIRGGQSSDTRFPKHSFHLFFSRDYGSPKLRFPLFGKEAASEFDTIDLRCEHGYAYADPYPYSDEFTAVRDVFCRDLWAAAGYASTRSRPYHLYLNGQYWGLYATQERAQEDYGSSYFGGGPEEYDVIKATGIPQLAIENTAGDYQAWTKLWTGTRAVAANPSLSNYFALQGRNADGSRNPTLPVLLDPHELAAYMLAHYYTGSSDSPLSVSFNWEKPNNFRAIRRRGLTEPFHFFIHDAESSMLAPEAVDNRANAVNLTSANRNNFNYSNPEWMHEDLLASTEYRLVVADEAQRLLFNGGAFTAAKAQPLWDALAAEIDQAVIGESIRWGSDFAKARQSVWAAKIAQVRTNFFPSRTARVIAQLRQRNQYPAIAAPGLNHYGGLVPAGFNVYLSNSVPSSVLYYAFNGTDPRVPGGGLNPSALAYAPGTAITINAQTTIQARVRSGTNWSAAVKAVFYTEQDFTQLRVSEIMYHPPDQATTPGEDLEFLELKNTGTQALDLSGATFTEGIAFTFAPGTSLPPGQFLVLGRSPALTNRYPGLTVHGFYTGKLDNSGEQITLRHGLGGAILSFEYKNSGRWPLTPDGWGFSLVPRDPDLSPDLGSPSHWRASTLPGGSPGADDPPTTIPTVLVNEVLTHTDLPDRDAIELFNPGIADADIGGWFLSDDSKEPRKFQLPTGTKIPAAGYLVFTELDFNRDPLTSPTHFSLSSVEDEVYLFSSDSHGNLTGYSHGFKFGGSANGVSFGRHVVSTGDEHFVAQLKTTLGASNSGPRIGPIVIQQIMYHPVDLSNEADNTADEFIELANRTDETVKLFDPEFPQNTWHLRGGVSYNFPPQASIPPGSSLLIVGFDPGNTPMLGSFRARFPEFAGTPTFGPYTGKLDNSRDTVEINRPDAPNTNVVPRIVVDEVTYRDSHPWPIAADGGGGSLQRIHWEAYGDDPINWSSVVPLTITLQPIGQAIRPGSNVVFTIAAVGTGPLKYQWRLNGVNLNDDGRYSGTTTTTLRVGNVQAESRGEYTAAVMDANGFATTLPAVLIVLIAPTIVVHPQSAVVVDGDLVTLLVQITNVAALPATYEWRVGNDRLQTNTVLSATNSFSFLARTGSTATTNSYRVVVKNAANPNPGLISATAIIVVLPDADGDHLPDLWETLYGFETTDPTDAALDPDGDGLTNLQEYRAGTHPRDGQSSLRLDVSPHSDSFWLFFQAVSNRSYSILTKENLSDTSWKRWRDFSASPTNRLISLIPIMDSAGQFYLLTTPQAP